MKLIINKDLFLNKFLILINKITDKIILNITNENIRCVSNLTEDKQSIIFSGKYILNSQIDENVNIRLNIPKLKKLINALNCINEENIELIIEENNIKYDSKNIKFQYHLFEDGLISPPIVTHEKIDKMSYNFKVELQKEKLNEIIKGCTFNSDVNKIYFYIKDGILYGEINDKTLTNIDNISFLISENFEGKSFENSVPLNLEIFRILSTIKVDKIIMNYNSEIDIVCFEITDQEILSLKYIVSSLVK